MGRPRNPYTDAACGQVPTSVAAWLERHLRTKRGVRPPDEFFVELPNAISQILEAGPPRPLRYIEALLTFGYGIRPDEVNRAASAAPGVVRTELRGVWENEALDEAIRGRRPITVLSYNRAPTNTELNTLRRMYVKYTSALTAQRVGKAAEYYVHGVLAQSGAYRKMKRSKVGELRSSIGKHKLDLLVVEKASGRRFAISIKNLRGFIYETHPAFTDLLSMAEAHNASPWLIATFLLPEAKKRAAQLGMRWHELGAQILPATVPDPKNPTIARRTQKIVSDARQIIGPLPTRIVPYHRFPLRKEWEANLATGVGLDAWTLPDASEFDLEMLGPPRKA